MIVSLSKDKYFTITQAVDGAISVSSFNGGQIVSTGVSGGVVQGATAVAVADEQLTLFDGKTLKRIRDNLTIE